MRNPGIVVKVLSGVHALKTGFAYNRDQYPQIIKAGKVCAYVPSVVQASLFPDLEKDEWKKVLFDKDKLQIIGFID